MKLILIILYVTLCIVIEVKEIRKIFETYYYNEKYSCWAFTEEIELVDGYRNWTEEEMNIYAE